MNKKIDYIGTVENPEITELKGKYIRLVSKVYDYFDHSKLDWGQPIDGKPKKRYMLVTYMDRNYIQQFRREIWEKIDEHTFRVQQMTFVKDNMQEGESIHIIWE